jgi:hypothetical protein
MNKNRKREKSPGIDLDDDIFAEENMNADFNAEDFFGVKQENLEPTDFLAGASDSLMEKYIEAMSGG